MFKLLKSLLLTIILIISGFVFSQDNGNTKAIDDERQEISLTDLIDLMSADGNTISIRNYIIKVSEKDDEIKTEEFDFDIFEVSPKNKVVKKRLVLHNCIFKLDKEQHLVFKDWSIKDLQIVGCEFYGRVEFKDATDYNGALLFIENSIFHDQFEIFNFEHRTTNLRLSGNEFRSEVLIDAKLKEMKIENCNFNADSLIFKEKQEIKTFYQLDMHGQDVGKLILTNNVFNNNALSYLYSVNFSSSNINELKMISNRMQTLDLSGAEVSKSFLVDSLFVEDYIGILNFNFPENNTNISWYNFSGEKFSIFQIEENMIIAYQAKTDIQLSDNLLYNDLMSAYNKFNALYHDRGDIVSANASYVEIKNIETRKQAFVQTINPSPNNFINYNLNVFLRRFSDYATNPGKSLKYSVWLILLFTILYMITYSRWDRMDYRYYLNQFNKFSEYVINDYPIEDVFRKKEDELSLEVVALQKKYIDAGKEMPRILKLIGGPLHFLAKFRFDALPGLIRFFNFQKDKWSDIKGFKKVWAGFLIVLIFFLFSIYVVLVKLFNSLIMSLNSFVVIGFGSLPEEDTSIAMYLSIIEGIIGWFLLTIFTITLLSQVLQNA